MTETFPAFFAQAPTQRVRDPLAQFLGAATDGVLEYHYADAVRLAGHSCPTVAGAYLLTRRGLRALYGDALPERGGIAVQMRDSRDSGTTGVIAAVATLLTGAAAETGFGGIGAPGRFRRRDLLSYDAPLTGLMALTRVDNGARVELELNASIVPFAADMQTLMPKAIGGQATPAEQQQFAALWQARVRAMLIDHAHDPQLIEVSPWAAPA